MSKQIMTRQEVFTTVVQHLRKQGERSYDHEMATCAYRALGGLKCAAGILIDDEHYSPALERNSVTHDDVIEALKASGVPTDNKTIDMLSGLQDTHDDTQPDGWETEFVRLAKGHGMELGAT